LDVVRIGEGGTAPTGVRIASLQPGGPAERAGLRRDDLIVAIAGRPVSIPVDVINAVEAGGVGRPLAITIERSGGRQTLEVRPVELQPQGVAQGQLRLAPR
jgi:S1-C subfamily serine protease